ncbi:MAG TPA: aminotransferase class V-fold PLP-dependent enzyme [Candidatus Caenarcaniphilales bacterium]
MVDASLAHARLARQRQQFPALSNKTYFNYGGQGPLSQPAQQAILQAYEYVQQEGPFSGQVNQWVAQEAAQTRQLIAQELGVPPETITLTEAVSIGCNVALWGINWQVGDHLLLSDCEHPGIVAAAQQISRRFSVEVSTCPLLATLNEGDPAAIVTQHLRPNTRLVVLSHIFWNTGQVLPLAEIIAACRHHPTPSHPVAILVDAAQSVGVLPLNLNELDVDFYAFTGHKWWCGPEGIGGLYIRPEALERLQPTFIGWRGITTDESGQPLSWQPDGRRFEIATSAFPLCAGLRAAIALHQQWGTAQERYQRILRLSEKLWQQLNELPFVDCLPLTPPEAGLVSFQIQGQINQQLVKFLEAQRIMVRLILHPNCVRACVHYFTLESELNQLVEVIQEFYQA